MGVQPVSDCSSSGPIKMSLCHIVAEVIDNKRNQMWILLRKAAGHFCPSLDVCIRPEVLVAMGLSLGTSICKDRRLIE